jgi:uncharacterized membrane protein
MQVVVDAVAETADAEMADAEEAVVEISAGINKIIKKKVYLCHAFFKPTFKLVEMPGF